MTDRMELSPRDLAKSKKELNEDPTTRAQAIGRLRKAVEGFPGLTCPTDDAFLLRFLRGRKFDEDRALHLIRQYYRVRNEYPELFDNWRPSLLKEGMKVKWFNELPLKDKEGQTIVWWRPAAINETTITYEDITRSDFLTLDILTSRPDVQVNGITFICDMKGFTMTNAIHICSPSNNKRALKICQDSYPLRIKGIHYINEPGIISYVWPLFKQFMKQKIIDRVHFHGTDLKSLQKHFSPEMIPEELGGTLKNYWTEIKPKNVNHYLSEEARYKDEEKNCLIEDTPGMKGSAISGDALQGMSGSFRKLGCD